MEIIALLHGAPHVEEGGPDLVQAGIVILYLAVVFVGFWIAIGIGRRR
jgi:hypothetical protein